jgi:tetratricopeptide (TPR) repeat protein
MLLRMMWCRLGFGVFLVMVVTACATVPVAVESVTLDTLVLHSDSEGKVRAVEARGLFKEGQEAYTAGRYAESVEKFVLVATLFPSTSYVGHAHFNAGLGLLKLERWEDAISHFQTARGRLTKHRDRSDACIHLAAAYEATKQWAKTVEVLTQALAIGQLLPVDVVETYARLGDALYRQGKLADAEDALKKALEGYRDHIDIPALHQNRHVARAQYLIGEIYQRLFGSIQFRLPVAAMKRDLTDKSHFFLKSQSAFMRCIRLRHSYWAVAAGFQLGKLYEDFYDHMMASEVPSDMSRDDQGIYFDELKRYIKPLVVRAIDVYERNIGMSDRLGENGEWAKKTQERLERMRTILRTEFKDLEGRP